MSKSGVWYRFRAEARRRALAWIVLGAIFGLAAGTIIAAVAGAHRTTNTYERFAAERNGLDAAVVPVDYCPSTECDVRRAETLPGVADSALLKIALPVGGRIVGGDELQSAPLAFFAAPVDGRFGREVNQWRVLEGRVPDPATLDEVIVTRSVAESVPLDVGDRVEIDLETGDAENPAVTTVEVEVVGIEISPNELEPLSGAVLSAIYATPALVEARPELWITDVLGVRLDGGADARDAFAEQLEPLDLASHPTVDSERQAIIARERFRDDASTLLVFAGFGAIACTVLAAQALHRQHVLDNADSARLRAIGWSRSGLRRVAVLRSVVVAIAAALTASTVAAALSPLAPVGEARELAGGGFDLDATALLVGFLATLAGFLVIGALTAEVAIRRRTTGARRAPRSVVAAIHALPSLPARLGSAITFERSARTVPVVSVVASLTLGIAAIVGAATFAASLDHLEATPALYGQPWDAVVFAEDPESFVESDAERQLVEAGQDSPELFAVYSKIPRRAALWLAERDDIDAVSLAESDEVTIGDIEPVPRLAFSPITGELRPTILDGRPPTAEDEIAVGPRLLRDLGLHVGDTVEVSSFNDDNELEVSERRIVGRSVTANQAAFFDTLGGGIVEPGDGGGDLIFVTYAEGVDTEALMDDLQERGIFGATDFEDRGRPVLDIADVKATPVLVAALTGVLLMATLVHFGVVASRRHLHHLGVLRALGLRRRECVRVLTWHGLVVAVLALLAGVPLGLIAGRAAWTATADSLFVIPQAAAPAVSVILLPLLLAVTVTIAMVIPGWLATRQPPAAALRSE